MSQPTAYQYVKLGSNLEFLRGISTASVMQTTSLADCPNLLDNFSSRRYSVLNVASALKSLLAQLQELQLVATLRTAEPLLPMLKSMEDYLQGQRHPEHAYLTDFFADRLVALAVKVGTALRTELGMASVAPRLPSEGD